MASFSLDSTKLSTALTNNPDGVRQLLMGRAQFSQSGFTAINSNSLTKSGTSTIEVTSVPTKAKLVGGVCNNSFRQPTGANVLKLSIDGTPVTANLATSYILRQWPLACRPLSILVCLLPAKVTVHTIPAASLKSPLAKQAIPPKWRYSLALLFFQFWLDGGFNGFW